MDYELFKKEANAELQGLCEKFIEPPFSVLNGRTKRWQARKNLWHTAFVPEAGRESNVSNGSAARLAYKLNLSGAKTVSVFDPVLCELLYSWFCPDGGWVLDPFCGGVTRGAVAKIMGLNYTGIDVRWEQVKSNIEQMDALFGENKGPFYICGDSLKILDTLDNMYDFILSCPPYFDLEVYSDMEEDLSQMDYKAFIRAYRAIVKKSCELLKPGGYAAFVVGEVRGKDGGYLGLVPATIKAFVDAGMLFYNEAILVNASAAASVVAAGHMRGKKLVKIHQNILVFKKKE